MATPFELLLAMPLDACLKAQMRGAINNVEYIREVGFEGSGKKKGKEDDTPKVRMITFEYTKPSSTFAFPTKTLLSVPILSLLPFPFLRLDYMEVHLNIKIMSEQTSSIDNSTIQSSSYSSEGKGKGFLAHSSWAAKSNSTTNMNSVIVNRGTVKGNANVKRDYHHEIKLKVTGGNSTPAGIARLLDMMQQSIQEDPMDDFLFNKIAGGMKAPGPGQLGPTGGAGATMAPPPSASEEGGEGDV